MDLETGQVWKWEHDKFVAANDVIDKNGSLSHAIEKQVIPQLLMEKLQKAGIDVEVAIAYKEDIGDTVEVACVECGRTANAPVEILERVKKDGSVVMCPDCMLKIEGEDEEE